MVTHAAGTQAPRRRARRRRQRCVGARAPRRVRSADARAGPACARGSKAFCCTDASAGDGCACYVCCVFLCGVADGVQANGTARRRSAMGGVPLGQCRSRWMARAMGGGAMTGGRRSAALVS
ncbi:hypothetical protein PsYK624_166490 [Phanerochaete sordida]|uniref:Uncharacterized protein n=1 Tax=Phanerochaete sordida TaxID=48140 RepID=A0A9P3LNW2_9APHY|nr:hypothetical protein PsYK624_166490 [Phanerochaete sordida]